MSESHLSQQRASDYERHTEALKKSDVEKKKEEREKRKISLFSVLFHHLLISYILQSWSDILFLNLNQNALKLLKPSQDKPFQVAGNSQSNNFLLWYIILAMKLSMKWGSELPFLKPGFLFVRTSLFLVKDTPGKFILLKMKCYHLTTNLLDSSWVVPGLATDVSFQGVDFRCSRRDFCVDTAFLFLPFRAVY